MRKSIRDTSKKKETRGRKKTTGPGEPVMLRLHRPLLTDLDEWIRTQDPRPSRPEAVRRILEQTLRSPLNKEAPRVQAVEKASALADRAAENLVDKSMPPEEQQRRKRALIEGPKEFRDIREDCQREAPKAKL